MCYKPEHVRKHILQTRKTFTNCWRKKLNIALKIVKNGKKKRVDFNLN